MTRLLLNKKETNRRKRDEADIALGGMGGGHARGGGLEEEFDDILRGVSRTKASKLGDGYDELRRGGKKADALSRSRARTHSADDDAGSSGRPNKRGRFESAVKNMNRRGSRRGRGK